MKKHVTLFLTILIAAIEASATPILDEAVLIEAKVCQKDAVIAFPCELYFYKGHRYVVGYLKESRKVFHVEELLPDGSSRVLFHTAYVHEAKT